MRERTAVRLLAAAASSSGTSVSCTGFRRAGEHNARRVEDVDVDESGLLLVGNVAGDSDVRDTDARIRLGLQGQDEISSE